MLRALWGLGIMDCVGILVSLDPHAQPEHAHHPATPRPPPSEASADPAARAAGRAPPPASEGAADEGSSCNTSPHKWRKLSRTAASSSSIVTSALLEQAHPNPTLTLTLTLS